MTRRGSPQDPKVAALRESRCLNPHPEQVTDEALLAEEFFDARDAVQVKYEMVRRVSVDGAPWPARRRFRQGRAGRRSSHPSGPR
jgi:hypothetical protein